MPLVAGVDSSTQKTLLELRDLEDGHLAWSGRRPHPPTTPPRSEQDPAAWWAALSSLLDEAVAANPTAELAGIAVAGQQHGMVVLDDAGTVLRPAKLWNDTESAPDAAALVERLGVETWAATCGSVPTAAFTVTKLAWLARCEPEVHARVARVLLPHDYLTWRLTGATVTDRGDASGTGWFSPATDRWVPELLALVGLDTDRVPRVLRPFELAGSWRGTVVAPGTGDNMAAALGLGLHAGDVVVSVGTSGTVYALSDRPSADPSGAVCGFADASGRFLPLVCTLNAGKVIDTFARLLGVDAPGFDTLAGAAPARGGGATRTLPVLVPYLDGERTPNLPDASGALVGLRPDTGREALALGVVRGVVCHLLDARDALTRAGVPTDDPSGRLVLVGGGGASGAVRGALADLAGRPVHVPAGEAVESVALGACVQAACVVSARTPDEVGRDWGLRTEVAAEPDPDPGAAERAAEARATYADTVAGLYLAPPAHPPT